ncbi:MAG: hypothetical protein L0I76_18370 [Pseudonocardia sp.]|nr:hypothetical protein [Pseudonocardia sp.]
MTSSYHIYAAGIDPELPVGLLVWFHGDGAYEFDNPTDQYCLGGDRGVVEVARARNLITLVARTPDTTGDVTWWESGAVNADYARDLIQQVGYDAYPIASVWLDGHSGGAQFVTQYLLPTYPAMFERGGGSVVFGGGGDPEVTPATFSSTLKSSFAMHWYTGVQDIAANSDEGYGGYGEAQNGVAYYAGQGFTTTAEYPAGTDHEQLADRFGLVIADVMNRAAAPGDYAGSTLVVSQTFESGTGYTSGDWSRVTAVQHSGAASLRSAATSNSGTSDAVFPVPNDALTVRFWYQTSSELDGDFLQVLVGGDLVWVASGPSPYGWVESAPIGVAGASSLTFRYAKDGSTADGSDAAWIDDVAFELPAGIATPVGQAGSAASTAGLGRGKAGQVGAPGDVTATTQAVSGREKDRALDAATSSASTAAVSGQKTGVVGAPGPTVASTAALTWVRGRLVGQAASEASTAPVSGRKDAAVGGGAAAGAAFGVSARRKLRQIGQGLAQASGFQIRSGIPGHVGHADAEATTAPLGRASRTDVGAPDPTDASTPALFDWVKVRPLPAAAATATAAGLSRVKTYLLGQATAGASTAPLAARVKTAVVGQAAALAQALRPSPAKRRDVGRADSAGSTWPIGHRAKVRRLGQAVARAQPGSVFTPPTVTDEAFAEAIAAPDRQPLVSLKVDWTDQDFTGLASDLAGCITSVTIERSITGELPDEAGLVDGYASASLKAQLGGFREGSDVPLAVELSPYHPQSLQLGAAQVTAMARCDIGMLADTGPKLVRQFTGPVRTLRVGEGDSTVQLDALDPSERLRALITLPTYAEFITHAHRRPWAFTVNSQWVVDYVLRKNSIYASPPPRSDAIISCTGHGGLAAEIGFNGAPISLYGSGPSPLWTEDDHPFGMLGTAENPDGGTTYYQEFYGTTDQQTPPFKFQSGYGVGLSCWLHVGDYMNLSSSFENRLFQIRPATIVDDNADNEYPRLFISGMGDGRVYAGLTTDSSHIYATSHIQAGAGRWRFFGIHFQYRSNTLMRVTIRMDGVTTTEDITVPSISPEYRPTLQCNGQGFRAWSNLQVWPSYEPPTLAEWIDEENWVGEADIGRGLNELLYLPDVAAADSWDVLKEVVGAEYGTHGFTPEGRYFFRPRTDSRPDRVDAVLDVDTNLADVAYTHSSDSVRNVIGYETKPFYHSGELQTVWQAQDIEQFVVPGGTLKVFEVDWPWGAAGFQGGTIPYYYTDGVETNQPQWSGGDVVNGFTYSYGTDDYSGEQNVQSVVVTYVQTGARTAQIIVDNTAGSWKIRLATDLTLTGPGEAEQPGEPALRIGGWPLMADVPHVAAYSNPDSIVRYRGERALALGSSEWRQTPNVLEPIVTQLLDALADANPVLEDLPVRGDPRVQVGQVASCRFRGGGAPVVGTIVKTVRTIDGNGLTDQISVRPLAVQTLAPPGHTFYVDISYYQDAATPIDLPKMKALGYAGCVARIGQGSSTSADHGEVADTSWVRFRDEGRVVWPDAFAGYWYLGDTESAADQAARCAGLIGDKDIPVMLDWESAGGGDWQNCVDVLAAFQAEGLNVTMLYTSSGTAAAGGASDIDGTGLYVVKARFWTLEQGHPRTLWENQEREAGAGWGFEPFSGATVDAHQFTGHGEVYPGMVVDVNDFPGTAEDLADMLNGRPY